MAANYDNKSNGTATTTSPITWTHTCGANANLLVVGFLVAASTATQTVTAVTYNGVSLTQIGSPFNDGAGGTNLSLWYLFNPATGSNTISATFSSISTTNGAAISFNGANAYDTTSTNTGTGTSVSTTITPTEVGSIIVDFISNTGAAGNTITKTGSQTVIHNQIQNGGATSVFDMSIYNYNALSNPFPFTYTLAGTGTNWGHRMATFTSIDPATSRLRFNKLRPRVFAPGLAR